MTTYGARSIAGCLILFASATATAGGVPGVGLDEVVITAKRTGPPGNVPSASQGTVTPLWSRERFAST